MSLELSYPHPEDWRKASGKRLRTFEIEVMVVPTVLEMKLLGATMTRELRVIEGYSLKDAKQRAGIL